MWPFWIDEALLFCFYRQLYLIMMEDYGRHSPCLWLLCLTSPAPWHHITQEHYYLDCILPKSFAHNLVIQVTWGIIHKTSWANSSLVTELELKASCLISSSPHPFTLHSASSPEWTWQTRPTRSTKQEYILKEEIYFCHKVQIFLQTSHKCHPHRPYTVVILFKFIVFWYKCIIIQNSSPNILINVTDNGIMCAE